MVSMLSLVLGTVRCGRASQGGIECQEAGVECSSLMCQLANKSIREILPLTHFLKYYYAVYEKFIFLGFYNHYNI